MAGKTRIIKSYSQMGYDNPEEIPYSELQAMCLISLTDLEPVEAAQVTLGYLFAGHLSAGQIENLSHQMLTEKLWEEYPELSLHEGFFKATQLLHMAYNGKFPRAEAVQFHLKLTPEGGGSLSLFDSNPEPPLPSREKFGYSQLRRVKLLSGNSNPYVLEGIWLGTMSKKIFLYFTRSIHWRGLHLSMPVSLYLL